MADYGNLDVGILRRHRGEVGGRNPGRTDHEMGKWNMMRERTRLLFGLH
jgi:hypothetical protein